MIKFLKRVFRFLMGRPFLVSLFLLIQLLIVGYAIWLLGTSGYTVILIFEILGVFLSLFIINSHANPAYKISWILFVLAVPLAGSMFYLFFGRQKYSKKNYNNLYNIVRIDHEINGYLIDTNMKNKFKKISSYIKNTTHLDYYANTYTKLLTPGEIQLTHMLEELNKAKYFIFMEYFIIREGTMWSSIYEILKRKSKEGLDIRIMYDDFGSINKIDSKFKKNLIKDGIKVVNFNPYRPKLSLFMNYRDHRKITIIDGNVAFTGGVNIGDEYINLNSKLGYWKDTSIMLRGKAVWNLTVLFLQIWEFSTKENQDFDKHRPTITEESDGIVHVFGDSPVDNHLVTENVYISIINNAKKYVYITTPYLIIDNELLTALKSTAISGVDVRIIVPHIPDKKIIFYVTQSYYKELITSGVKIYEYIPGFLHSKTIVSDDEIAMIGTVNLDYRSLYLHFENSCLLYNTSTVHELRNDCDNILSLSKEITLEEAKQQPLFKRIIAFVLRAFSPLM